MRNSRTMEISVGLLVLAGMAAMIFLAVRVADIAGAIPVKGYRVSAYFENVGSLKVRAPVTVSGVKIGEVESVAFDEQHLNARVVMVINARYDKLPADTGASILTAGLLGEQYIGLLPGADDETLRDGSIIEQTQSALVLENIVGKFLTQAMDKAK